MSAAAMMALVGRRGSLRVAGSLRLRFDVEVLDVRQRFGGLDYLVRPVAGSGEAWHSSDLVHLEEVAS